MPDAWIIDDEAGLRLVLSTALEAAGFGVREFAGAEEALAALDSGAPDVVFTDVRMPGLGGIELMRRLHARAATLPVIVMSAYADLTGTVAAYAGGAYEYLPKPFDLEQAVAIAQRAAAESLPPPADDFIADADLIGETPAMREVFRTIGRLARAQLSVLITGETGTGKELVARALHRHSPRAKGPFIALNTAAIPSELLESELFGHESGAFTGALRRHLGRFEQAHGGTLFLDEIGDMPVGLQTRLLRVLAEGEFYRIGGRELIRTDVRVIAATHQDLAARVQQGTFRADLLHRLDVVRLRLPPLRERAADVPRLAEHFLASALKQMGLEDKRFTRETLALLARQRWPGNVRELENLCRHLAVMAPGREILPGDLPEARSEALSSDTTAPAEVDWRDALAEWARAALDEQQPDLLAQAREQLEHTLFEQALARTGNNRQEAAKLLGCGRNTLTRKLGARTRS